MNIHNNKKISVENTKSIGLTKEDINPINCSANYSSQDGSLIIHSNDTRMHDASKSYYINKDGSGTLVTCWGRKEYSARTFDKALNLAKIITEEKGFQISLEDTLKIIELLEQSR